MKVRTLLQLAQSLFALVNAQAKTAHAGSFSFCDGLGQPIGWRGPRRKMFKIQQRRQAGRKVCPRP